ncbi:hypothetical protein HDU86_003525 [Geranomyces michiganensis]|nr:hypothetical protein HDU86_003525 [Geranomyces michiganensis]
MARDKRKKRKDHAVKKAASTSKKANKQASKAMRKDARLNAGSSDEEEDIELLIKQFNEVDRKNALATEETPCTAPPSPRANASWVASPLDNTTCYLFGGECFNGSKLRVFGDLFKYRIDKKAWSKITCAVAPGPRSGHQTVALPSGSLLTFGGEFATASQNQFHHYKDCWMFNIKEARWTQLEGPTPSARSGHRMAGWNKFFVLYGGFFDNGRTVKYHDDLWIFDTTTYAWTKVDVPAGSSKPSARSGFQFFTSGDKIYLYGGYAKKVASDNEATLNKANAGGGDREKGIVYSDMWALTMSTDFAQLKWEKLKKSGTAIPPSRAGCSIAVHKNRAILFGGVEDDEAGSDSSMCWNDMRSFAIDSRKWFPFVVKKAKSNEGEGGDSVAAATDGVAEATGPVFDSSVPHPRYNAMLAVQKNQLVLFGGLFEQGKNEFTLNDLWTLNLDKNGPWECVQRGAWDRQAENDEKKQAAATEKEDESDSDSDSSSGSESN